MKKLEKELQEAEATESKNKRGKLVRQSLVDQLDYTTFVCTV